MILKRFPIAVQAVAINRKVSGSTQGQALNALVFFFARVLEKPLGQIGPYKRPKKPKRLPTVLSPKEIHSLFEVLNGTNGLMIRLMYGTGMRVILKSAVNLASSITPASHQPLLPKTTLKSVEVVNSEGFVP